MRLMIAALIVLMLAACSQAGSPVDTIALVNSGAPPTAIGAVVDAASLTEALRASGAVVAPDGQVALAFLRGSGTLLRVDDQRVQVYEYPAAADARQDAARFSQDGAWVNGDLGTLLVNWFDTPHLYQVSRLIAVYVGDHAPTLALLQNVLGTPFAGGANPYRTAAAVRSAD
jgi:hypothetical protein